MKLCRFDATFELGAQKMEWEILDGFYTLSGMYDGDIHKPPLYNK